MVCPSFRDLVEAQELAKKKGQLGRESHMDAHGRQHFKQGEVEYVWRTDHIAGH